MSSEQHPTTSVGEDLGPDYKTKVDQMQYELEEIKAFLMMQLKQGQNTQNGDVIDLEENHDTKLPKREVSRSSENEILYPLLTMEDYRDALYTSTDCKTYVIKSSYIDPESAKLQLEFCLGQAPYMYFNEDDLKMHFDKYHFLKRVKWELALIEAHDCLKYVKLSKEITFFYKFPPREALRTIFDIITGSSFMRGRVLLVPAFLRILIISAIGGINPENPDHVATVMNCMSELDGPIHVSHFFTLMIDVEQLLLKFFKKELGWGHNESLSNCDSITDMFNSLNTFDYVEFHPAFNVIFCDVKKDKKFHFSDSIDELGDHLNVTCFSKFQPSETIKLVKGVYKNIDSENKFTAEIKLLKAKLAAEGVKPPDSLLDGIVQEYNRMAKDLNLIYKQRDYLITTQLAWLFKDFCRDPKFRRESINIFKKFNAVLLKNNELLPLNKLKQIIKEVMKDDVFSPSHDITLMLPALFYNFSSFDQTIPFSFPDNPLASHLKKMSQNSLRCCQCKIFHSSLARCIPAEDDLHAWKTFELSKEFRNEPADTRNTMLDYENFFNHVQKCKSNTLSSVAKKSRSRKKKMSKQETAASN